MELQNMFRQKLAENLADCVFFRQAECYQTITSTSDRLRELAKDNAPEGSLVVAEEQTAGRGRMGRRFYSPKNCGLYMSLLLRPKQEAEDAGLLTACGAVAVWQAVRKLTGVSVDIKWVNDLYFQKKKLCGILAEGQFDHSGKLAFVVLGIGINTEPPAEGYNPEIDGKTISLSEIAPEIHIDKGILCAEIFRAFAEIYMSLPDIEFLNIYRQYSCVLGKTVSYEQNGSVHSGLAVEIDHKARLKIKKDDGSVVLLGTGEISLLKQGL